jgi:hypothetical protein
MDLKILELQVFVKNHMGDIIRPSSAPPGTIFLCSLNAQAPEGRYVVVWKED